MASKKLISTIQGVLADEGFAPSKSQKESGGYDGIYGPETKKALEDWQNKNKMLNKKAIGGQTMMNPVTRKDTRNWLEYLND